MTETYFAPCPRGLESLLADELLAAGAQQASVVAGGVRFEGDGACCRRANLCSRLATRILWRVAEGRYKREEDIYQLARDVAWPRLFGNALTLRVATTAIRSPLRSIDFITLRVKDAVCDRFRDDTGSRPSVDTRTPDIRVHVFLTSDHATLYLDTSGDPLYKRGFKPAAVGAPLKENLAAGIVMLAGWRGDVALFDPMCGSGSILSEAAQIALDVAPGLGRGFAFEKFVDFDADGWRAMLDEASSRRRDQLPVPIFGADLYGDELKQARQNLAAAGLGEQITLKQGNVLDLAAPAAEGVMVANPPYGVRLGDRADLALFYPKLGDALKRRYAGWRCYIFSADTDLPKGIGLKASRRTPLFNGALECRLYEFKVVQGSMRRVRPNPEIAG